MVKNIYISPRVTVEEYLLCNGYGLDNVPVSYFSLPWQSVEAGMTSLSFMHGLNVSLLVLTILAVCLVMWVWHREKRKGRKDFERLNQLTRMQHQWLMDGLKKRALTPKTCTPTQPPDDLPKTRPMSKLVSFSNFSTEPSMNQSSAFNAVKPTTMIRISLVDDHKLFRSGIRALLSAYDNFEVVSESDNGKEFTETVEHMKPDVVLMDLEMPEMDGMETTKYLKEHHPDVKVIVISMHNDEKFIVHLMEIGAHGYLLKNADPEDIVSAILSVHETGYHFTELVSRVLLHGLVKGEKVKPSFLPGNDLTTREIEVLKLICQENTAAEIGEKLFISPRTVEGHRNNLLIKTGARNIAGIVVFAMKNGFYE